MDFKNVKIMKRTGLMVLYLAMMCLAVTSCKGDGDNENDNRNVAVSLGQAPRPMEGATVGLVAKGDLPEWLVEKVEQLEALRMPLVTYKVYRCTWRSQTVYYIYTPLASCMMCETYYQNGKKVEWESEGQVEDFCDNSTDWKCVYIVQAE